MSEQPTTAATGTWSPNRDNELICVPRGAWQRVLAVVDSLSEFVMLVQRVEALEMQLAVNAQAQAALKAIPGQAVTPDACLAGLWGCDECAGCAGNGDYAGALTEDAEYTQAYPAHVLREAGQE